jgi:beta-glucosidase
MIAIIYNKYEKPEYLKEVIVMRGKRLAIRRGLTAILTFLLVLSIVSTNALLNYAAMISGFLGTSSSKIVTTGDTQDTVYYKSEFGDYNSDNLAKLEEAAFEHNRNEVREGSVLLKNVASALPLAESERKVTLFGHASYEPMFRTFAAGSTLTSVPEKTTDLREALESKGFQINQTLWDAYADDPAAKYEKSHAGGGGGGAPAGGGAGAGGASAPAGAGGAGAPARGPGGGEITIENGVKAGGATGTENPGNFYEKYASSWEEDYNDAAIVVISRQGSESADILVSEPDDDGSGPISGLALHKNEKDMMDVVASSGFGKIIVLVNSPYAIELGWLDDYSVDACLWISTPGSAGFGGVAEILTGIVNPSGQLADTFAADSLSSPAVVNGNGNTPKWANVDEIHDSGILTDGTGQHPLDNENVVSYVNTQQENIYIGYKYYETRYADGVTGQGDALSSVGAFASQGSGWNYADEVCYPFGFGLSYTTFSQEIESVKYDEATDTYDVNVKVANVGGVPGKKAVLLYVQTPYGDYEKQNNVEKSAVVLVGYEKSKLLAAGESETLTITVDRYLLASYDQTLAKGYILSGGTSYFAVGGSAHDALNNILSAQGYTGLTDFDGSSIPGNPNGAKTIPTGLPESNNTPDTQAYSHSAATGMRVTNLFDYADYNYYRNDTGETIKYLSRQDWSGTFPVKPAEVLLKGAEMETLMQGNVYTTSADAVPVNSINQNQTNNLTFVMMKDVPWEDEATWNSFLDQFTLEELASFVKDMPGNFPMDKIALPEIRHADGCDSAVAAFPETLGYGENETPNTYNAGLGSVVYSSLFTASYNKDIQKRRGELMAEEMLFSKINISSTGGGDLRRTPFSGRNAEYYSEDSNLCSFVGEIELGAMQERGVIGGPKHFTANDQEFMRLGVNIFTTEQALREGSLRGFEYVLRSDKANLHNTMTTNVRIGMKWTPLNKELLTDVLRGEWGFTGTTNTDASFTWPNGFVGNIIPALMAGTDNNFGNTKDDASQRYLAYINEHNDGDMVLRLREVVKNCIYAWSHSAGVNGLSSNITIVTVTPGWIYAVYAIDAILAFLLALSAVLFVRDTNINVEGKK